MSGPWRSQRLRILTVKQSALAVLAAAFLAVPVGFVALQGDEPAAGRTVATRAPIPPSANDRGGGRAPASASSEIARNRGVVERVRGLSDDGLRALVTSGTELERLSALHVLWTRGHRREATSLAQQSGDRALIAKVAALESAVR